ncbi:MAG: hypothetical protein HC930_13475 [Hydrococcus sp. SU_1_0]|nr:hypothetical protein [Hydrococcus sp. SU_1_0]
MARLKDKPRSSLVLSLLLLLVTYAAEGLLYGAWMQKFVEHESFLTNFIESARISILYGAALLGIMLLIVMFTSPVFLLTVGLSSWLKSDTRALISILLGAFTFAIIVQRVDYFGRLLILVAAVFLGKLDLQLAGCNRWVCSLILILLCWFGFTGGILTFYQLNLLNF